MLRKTEIIADVVLDQNVGNQFKPTVSKRVHDEICLEAMRSIVKESITYTQENPDNDEVKKAFRNHYEEYRQQLNDEGLKAYTAFDLMEKLYWQEYLASR